TYPHDIDCFHHGRGAAGAVFRSGRRDAPGNGCSRILRYVGGDLVRALPDSGFLRVAAFDRQRQIALCHRARSARDDAIHRTLIIRNDDMNKPLRFRLGVGAAVLALAGCAVGPEYQRPAAAVPPAFKEASMSPEAAKRWKEAQPSDSIERGRWWTIFQDARLNELEEQAMVANQHLKAAAARVAQARALTKNARAELFPRVDAGFGPTRQRSSNASQGLPDDASNAP